MKLLDKIDWPKPGKYVIAVSGGVDSMALLHLLADRSDYHLVVAHVDHGWRPDSTQDKDLVETAAIKLGLCFEHTRLNLGSHSESEAREGRYEFLRRVLIDHKAKAIITAHHLDDRVETSIFNVLRGTHRYGLAPLKSTPQVLRPLLKVAKQQLTLYAKSENIVWREDSTNQDTSIPRNYIRHEILPEIRTNYTTLLNEVDSLNELIDIQLGEMIEVKPGLASLPIAFVQKLSLPALRHVLAVMMRHLDSTELDSQTIDQLAIHLKTARFKRRRQLKPWLNAEIKNATLAITTQSVTSSRSNRRKA